MRNFISNLLICSVLTLFFTSCEENEIKVKSTFPNEFYLLEKNCFGRFFFENPISGEMEYELYCSGSSMVNLTVGADSVCLKGEFSKTCYSLAQFYTEYGNPVEVNRLDHKNLHFKIDTIAFSRDTIGHLETDAMHRVKLQIEKDNKLLYDKIFKCNKLVLFDSSNINVYSPQGHPELYFIDGVSPCLVLEMEYYDEVGDFAGWERFSADIKAFPKKK